MAKSKEYLEYREKIIDKIKRNHYLFFTDIKPEIYRYDEEVISAWKEFYKSKVEYERKRRNKDGKLDKLLTDIETGKLTDAKKIPSRYDRNSAVNEAMALSNESVKDNQFEAVESETIKF